MADLTTSKLEALGNQLPHGLAGLDGARQDFSFKRSTANLEVAIGALKTMPVMIQRPGWLAVHALKLTLDTLAGEDMNKLPEEQAILHIARLPFVDVFHLLYARFWHRKKYVVADVARGCYACSKVIPAGTRMQVGDMLVQARPSWTEMPTDEVVFDEPIDLPGLGETERVTVEVPSWESTWYGLSQSEWSNDEAIKLRIAEAAVVGTPDKPKGKFTRRPKGWLGEADPSAYEQISDAIVTGFAGGPVPALPLPCPECATETPVPFSWRALAPYGR
jgi:hypothetical protein